MAAIRDISARKRAEAERSHLLRERALYVFLDGLKVDQSTFVREISAPTSSRATMTSG
jgi:hypothetical protein